MWTCVEQSFQRSCASEEGSVFLGLLGLGTWLGQGDQRQKPMYLGGTYGSDIPLISILFLTVSISMGAVLGGTKLQLEAYTVLPKHNNNTTFFNKFFIIDECFLSYRT